MYTMIVTVVSWRDFPIFFNYIIGRVLIDKTGLFTIKDFLFIDFINYYDYIFFVYMYLRWTLVYYKKNMNFFRVVYTSGSFVNPLFYDR